MLGLGLADGINRGLDRIDDRRRQERMDAESAEDRGMRREMYGLQMAEAKRQQATREGVRGIAQSATREVETAAPYVDEHSVDPEFGLAAAGVKPADDGSYGLQSVTKTQKLDRAKYEDEVERFLAEREGPEAAMGYRQKRSALMKEGFGDFARALAMGDIQGAEQVAATAGKPVKPGTLRVDKERDVVSGVSGDGKPFEMSFSAMLGVAGIRGKEQGGLTTFNPGQGIMRSDGTIIQQADPDKYGRSGAGGLGVGDAPSEARLIEYYVSNGIAKDHKEAQRMIARAKVNPQAEAAKIAKIFMSGINTEEENRAIFDRVYQDMLARFGYDEMADQGRPASAGGLQPPPSGEKAQGDGAPPVEGARKAADGNWYVQRDGKYYRVDR